MKTAALLSLLAGSAKAFTSTNVAVSPRSIAVQSSAMDEMVGAVDLRGKEFKYDPVSLLLLPELEQIMSFIELDVD